MGLHSFPVPRAILTVPRPGRQSCAYAGYCGSYGCATGAKGSSRAALLGRAIETGRCEVRAQSMASRILSDAAGRATAVEYLNAAGERQTVCAKIVVVACQPIESARLLLRSVGPHHPQGLANATGQVGRNLLFSGTAAAFCDPRYSAFDSAFAEQLRQPAPFLNRAIQDFYTYRDPHSGRRRKGGTLDLLFVHPNPIAAALSEAKEGERPVWGWPLKRRLERYFREGRHLKVEGFLDWQPTPDSKVTLDPSIKDRWGLPVARVRISRHPRNVEVARFLAERAGAILERLGGEAIETTARGGPSTNLVAGACRFGTDPRTSVLDVDCRAHHCPNLYVTDGSFMPTGGSVPYTWTIYANAFRVAEKIAAAV